MSPVIYYDDECGLCNHAVQYILKHDKKGRFRFAAQKSSLAKQQGVNPEANTIVLNTGKHRFYKSTAMIHILKGLPGLHKILAFAMRLLPVKFRDFLYETIAHNRQKLWWGTKSCLVPTEEQRARFLN